MQLVLALAGIPQHRKVIFFWSLGSVDCLGVDADEVLRVTHARPTAVVHRSCALVAGDRVEAQQVAVIVVGPHRRAADSAESAEHQLELLGTHLGTALEEER